MSERLPSPYLVVDASVSLKWALNDEDAVEQAISLRDAAIAGQFQMVAPSLWLYEITNGLITAVRRARLAAAMGEQMLNLFHALDVRMVDPTATDVYNQALRHKIAAYDAAYLALAEALNALLWTGDRRFFAAVSSTTPLIHWIGDYQ